MEITITSKPGPYDVAQDVFSQIRAACLKNDRAQGIPKDRSPGAEHRYTIKANISRFMYSRLEQYLSSTSNLVYGQVGESKKKDPNTEVYKIFGSTVVFNIEK